MLSLFLGVLAGAISASDSAASPLAKPLSASDLPTGYTVITPPLTPQLCSGLYLPKNSGNHLTIGFRSNVLTITEALSVSHTATATYRELNKRYSACGIIRPVNHLNIHGTGSKLALSRIGDQSQGFSFKLTINGTVVHEDLVLLREALSCVVLEFIAVGSALDSHQVEYVASIAASKANTQVS